MKTFGISLFLGFAGVIALLALGTALTSAAASLANGVAFATLATTLLTNQCISGFIALVTLVAGAAGGFGLAVVWRSRARQQPPGRWAPGPNARWGRVDGVQRPALPQQPAPLVYLPEEVEEEEETLLLDRWGF